MATTKRGKSTVADTALMDVLGRRFDCLSEKLDAIAVSVAGIRESIQENGDTTPEQVETYLNRIGRMMASGKFERATQFLRSVYQRTEDTQHITKRQMAAVDRINARGFVYTGTDERNDDESWPWRD